MAVQFLQQPTGEEYYPKRQTNIGGALAQIASILGERQKLRQQQQQESQLLSSLGIEPLGRDMRPEPTTLTGRIGRGLGDVLKAPAQRSDLMKAIMKAQVEAKFEPPKKYEPTTQEEALEFERAKAGIKEKKTNKKILGLIRKLKDANATVEDINKAIAYEGEEPEDYFGEIGAYSPQIKKRWWQR